MGRTNAGEISTRSSAVVQVVARSTRGAVFRAPRQQLVVEDLRLEPPGPGEILVRMAASGVCHSDLHVADGDWQRPSPLVLGHEGAAFVELLGDGVAETNPKLRPGALVVLAWTAPCRECPPCGRGEPWLCSRPIGNGHRLASAEVRLRSPDGSPMGAYCGIGTFGTHQVVASEAAIPVDPRTRPEVAALIGCAVATGVGAVLNTAHVEAGQSVAILGLGGVGLAAVMGAAIAGADPIVALDTQPAKLDLAQALGAIAGVGVQPADSTRAFAEARALAPADGFDHAFECAGVTSSAELALRLVRPGGTVTLVGMPAQSATVAVDAYRFVEDGKRIQGSNYGSSDPARAFPMLADLHLAGRLPVDRLISDSIRLEDVNEALDAMRRGEGARKVMLF
jgi:S-(hydroxymethyl)glutathione dehydrogenase/alcohol dehydrogenase